MLAMLSTERIAWGLLHSLWQGGLVGVLLMALLYATRCPFRRYAFSLGALVLLLISCAWTMAHVGEGMGVSIERRVVLPEAIEPMNRALSTSTPDQILPAGGSAAHAFEMAQGALGDWHRYLVGAWAFGVFLMAGRLGMISVQTMRLKRCVLPLEDAEIQALFRKLCDQLRITRFVRLGLTQHLEGPAVLGIVTPMILLPVHLVTSQPIEHLRAILIHELVHLRRHDCLVNAFQMLVETVLFFNPAVWLINRQIRSEREAICDHLSMGLLEAPGAYVRVLLDVMNGLKSRHHQLSMALVKQGDKTMLDRVRRLLVPGYKPVIRWGWVSVLVVLLCLSTLTVPILFASRRGAAQADSLLVKEEGAHSTIDDTMQRIVHQSLMEKLTEVQAESAHAILVDPGTGAILAMDSVASNQAGGVPNHAFSSVYEPGSLMKPLVIALALDEGVLTTSDTIDCEQGLYEGRGIGRIKEYNYRAFGMLTAKEILMYSSNIGPAKIGRQLGKDRLYTGLRRFGFGQAAGHRLPEAQTGLMRPLGSWDTYSVTRIPFGQEIAVTSWQILQAYTVFCNQGRCAPLHVDERLRCPKEEQERMVSLQIADWMRKEALTAVVNEGTAQRAKLQAYQVFGKTGTAQIAKKSGPGYEDGAYIASFAGGAPAENPRLLVIVSVRRPNRSLGNGYTGGAVAAPVAAGILAGGLAYLGD